MRRLRLAILGNSLCYLRSAACCKQNGHAYAALLQGDDERRRFAIDVAIEGASFPSASSRTATGGASFSATTNGA